jgi:hypothetical protein
MNVPYGLASLSIVILLLAAACSAPAPTATSLPSEAPIATVTRERPTATVAQPVPDATPTDVPVAQRSGWFAYDKANSELPDDYVRALAPDHLGGIWIGTYSAGLVHFDGEGWQLYDSKNSLLPADYVSALAVGAKGAVWVGTWRWPGALRRPRVDGLRHRQLRAARKRAPGHRLRCTRLPVDRHSPRWTGALRRRRVDRVQPGQLRPAFRRSHGHPL